MGRNDDYFRQQDRRRRQLAGRRRLALALFLLVVVAVVILVVVLSGDKKPSTTTTTTQSSESSTTNSTTGLGEDTTTSTSAGAPAGATYTAGLGGGNEIPPLTTAASGTLTLTVSADGSSVDYVLEVNSIISLTVARLHEGGVGDTGETILTIYGGPTKSGLYSGKIAEGSFTAADLEGPLKGKTIDALVALIEANSVYLNVGTEAHTDGEIRGQLQ